MNDELEFGTAASSDTPEPAVELNKQTESVPEAPVQRCQLTTPPQRLH